MMGWAMLAAMAAGAALLLVLLRFPRRLWTVPATALMLGAAGYAWQGSPTVAGHPVAAEGRAGRIDANLTALREAMFGKFGTYAWSYAVAADRMKLSGKPDLELAVWQGAVRKAPNDPALWTGFGVALAEHDRQVSPAARFAFERALALNPKHPGPPFFYGLALVREGRFADARPWWEKAVALTPAKASYRNELVMRLIALEMVIAEQARRVETTKDAPAAKMP